MKRIFLFFALMLMVGMTYAQTYTFYMHQADNTNYRIEIDVQSKYITATKGVGTVFSCNYYNHFIDNSQKRIGLSLQSGVNAVTSPSGSSYFIISRGKGIAIRLTNGTELSVMCNSSSFQSATYDQFARILNNPTIPSNNNVSSSTRNFLTRTQTSIFFKRKTSKIETERDMVNLRSIADVAKANPGLRIRVVGSAASAYNTPEFNQRLSEDRAAIVVQSLVDMGVKNVIILVARGGIAEQDDSALEERVVITFE